MSKLTSLSKKANVIFVNPSLSYENKKVEHVFPLTSIMILSTILHKAGYKIKIVDGNLFDTPDECFEEVKKSVDGRTTFIGFSVMTCQVPWAFKVTKKIKMTYPTVKVVWGGVHPTLFPEQTIESEYIDIIAVNESASIIKQLTDKLVSGEDLSSIPGLYYKKEGETVNTREYTPDDLLKIPSIDYSLFDYERYSKDNFLFEKYAPEMKNKRMFIVVTGLGCSYRCKFCINVILKRRYRFRNAEEIIDRIKYLQKEYGANCFEFLDEDFFISKKRLLRFLDLIEENNLKFLWRPWLRVDHFNDKYIDDELARRLEKNGMVVAVMGAECGSQRMLDYINKDISTADTVTAVKILKNTNISPRLSFMVGLPGESKKEILSTYRFALHIKNIDKRVDLQIYSFRLYPGSPLYNDAKEKFKFKEPTSLNRWADKDYIKNYGYLSYYNYKWIENLDEFERMRYLCDNFILGNTGDIGLLKRIIYTLFRSLAILRFKSGWFSFCFDISMYEKLKIVTKKTKKQDNEALNGLINIEQTSYPSLTKNGENYQSAMSFNSIFGEINDKLKIDIGFVKNISYPLFKTDKNQVITDMNRACMNVFGYSYGDVIGKMKIEDLIKIPDVYGEKLSTLCMKRKDKIVSGIIGVKKDGAQVPIAVGCSELSEKVGQTDGGFAFVVNIEKIDNL